MPNDFIPPFKVTVRVYTRIKNLKFDFDLIASTTDEAISRAQAMAVEAIRPLMTDPRFKTGDLRPIFYGVQNYGEVDPDEEPFPEISID